MEEWDGSVTGTGDCTSSNRVPELARRSRFAVAAPSYP
jgi:hypothetical protein